MRYVIAIVSVLTLVSSSAHAEDSGGGVCPEFANSIAAMRKSGGASKELGLENASAQQKKKGLYRGWDQSVRLEGPKASVAVRNTTTFAFKPMNANVNPNQQIKLYPFKTAKKYRELMVGGMNNFGGTKEKSSKDDSITLKFNKISKGCYKVAPTVKLPPGQYAFSLGAGADVEGSTTFGASTQGQTWFGFAIVE
ncbi:MAG: hypothetical protein AAF436_07720 [Myxococcota bacterium]